MLNKQWGKEYRAHKKWVALEQSKYNTRKRILDWHKREFVAFLVSAKLAGISERRLQAWRSYTPEEAYKHRKWLAQILKDYEVYGDFWDAASPDHDDVWDTAIKAHAVQMQIAIDELVVDEVLNASR